MWETAPSEVTKFSRKKVIVHEFDFDTSDLEFEVSIKHLLKAHNCVWQGCFFFFHYYLATSTTDWVQMFTCLLFYAYVKIQSSVFKGRDNRLTDYIHIQSSERAKLILFTIPHHPYQCAFPSNLWNHKWLLYMHGNLSPFNYPLLDIFIQLANFLKGICTFS